MPRKPATAAITAKEAVTGKTESKHMPTVKAALRAMMPTLIATLCAVLDNENGKESRAYVLSDLPGALTGDRQASFMLARRVSEAGMTQAMGRVTGKIRAEFARPLYDELAGVEVPNNEETAEHAEIVG